MIIVVRDENKDKPLIGSRCINCGGKYYQDVIEWWELAQPFCEECRK